jgi:hypothetical protein
VPTTAAPPLPLAPPTELALPAAPAAPLPPLPALPALPLAPPEPAVLEAVPALPPAPPPPAPEFASELPHAASRQLIAKAVTIFESSMEFLSVAAPLEVTQGHRGRNIASVQLSFEARICIHFDS